MLDTTLSRCSASIQRSGLLYYSLAFLFGFLLFALPVMVQAQNYDLLIKGGHVIDAKNDIDGQMDIAVKDGIIARVASNISETEAERVVNAEGLYVIPGIDRYAFP